MDGRRLAGAVRAEEAVDLAGRDSQVDPGDRLDVLELPPEPDRLDSLVAPAHSYEPTDATLASARDPRYT